MVPSPLPPVPQAKLFPWLVPAGTYGAAFTCALTCMSSAAVGGPRRAAPVPQTAAGVVGGIAGAGGIPGAGGITGGTGIIPGAGGVDGSPPGAGVLPGGGVDGPGGGPTGVPGGGVSVRPVPVIDDPVAVGEDGEQAAVASEVRTTMVASSVVRMV